MDSDTTWTAQERATLETCVERLLSGRSKNLASEIAITRLLLVRLLREEPNLPRLIDGLARLMNLVFRAVQLQRGRTLRERDLEPTTRRLLIELGYGAPAIEPPARNDQPVPAQADQP